MQEIKQSMTCITCRLTFSSADDQKNHYKTDFHRFNLKRKIAQLPPVSEEAFEQKNKTATTESDEKKGTSTFECRTCGKHFASENTHKQHLNSKKHLEKSLSTPPTPAVPAAPKEGEQLKAPVKQVTKPAERRTVSAKPQNDADFSDEERKEKSPEEEEEELIQEKLRNAVRLDLEDCLFCYSKAASFEENIEHMTESHGFFIPDIEYMRDLKGFIQYLGQKIGIGNICLYCNGKGRSFASIESVRGHMRDLSHCKILYDDNEDEFAEYYDFSSDYGAGTNGEEGIEEFTLNKVTVSENGSELIFPNGKAVGHRDLLRYYKQRYRPVDQRDSVMLNKLVNQYRAIGWKTSEPNHPVTKDNFKNMHRRMEYQTKLGIQANGLQKHFRHQLL